MSVDNVRDWVIIVAGSLMVFLFLAMLVFTVIIGVATRAVLGSVRTLLNSEVTPLVGSARVTLTRVQGTATFISETTVSPIIRAYGVFAGARRAVGMLSGFATRRKQGPGGSDGA